MTVKRLYKKLNRIFANGSYYVKDGQTAYFLLNPSSAMRKYKWCKVTNLTIDVDIETGEPMFFIHI